MSREARDVPPSPEFDDDSRTPLQVPKPAAQRISLYLRYLEAQAAQGKETISSRELGSALGLTAAQVRKDLGHFGQFGHPGVGYRLADLIPRVRKIIGTDRIWKVALVGMGNLGSALSRYRGFEARGFQITALFDHDPSVIGREFPQGRVHSMEDLERVVGELGIELGILAVPIEAAQEVAERMGQAGIQGILNFAPRVLLELPTLRSVSVDLTIQLEQLALSISLDPPGETPGSETPPGAEAGTP